MMIYGDYRSACAAGLWDQAYIIANNINHPDERNVAINDWWRNAHLDQVVKHLVWSVYWSDFNKTEVLKEVLININDYRLDFVERPKNDMPKNNTLNLHIFDCFLANNYTLDWQSLHIEWALIAARSVLPLFETWAAAYAPEHLYAIRSVLDAAQHKDVNMLSKELIILMDNARRELILPSLDVADAVRLVAESRMNEQSAILRAASEVLRLDNELAVAEDEAEYEEEEKYLESMLASALFDLDYEILRSDLKNISKYIAYHAATSIFFAVKSHENNTIKLGHVAGWIANAQAIFDALIELKILERNEVDYKSWSICCSDKSEINLKRLSQDWSLYVLKTLRAKFLAQQ